MPKLNNKVILITGASKGIGLGCALVCLRYGAKVALLARHPAAAEADVQAAGFRFGERVLPIAADVCNASQVEAAIKQTIEHFRQLDGLINNAGWHPPAMTIDDTSLE